MPVRSSKECLLQEILSSLTAIAAGQSAHCAAQTDDPLLKAIVEKVNALAASAASRGSEENLLKRFFENCPIGLNLCRSDGTWLESNPAFLKMLGYTPSEANGHLNYWDLTPRDYAAAEKTEEWKTKNELEIERLKTLQAAKLASLGEMAAGVAHEINNPLAVIAGTMPLIKKHRLDDVRFLAKVEVVAKAAARIEKIVKGLKKFARNSEGSVRKREAVAELVREVAAFTEARAKSNSIPIFVSISTGAQIFCDVVEIEQVMVNLLNNAIDAVKLAEEKWIKVNAFEQGGEVVMQIIDSGTGIPAMNERKIFQPFFTTKPVGEGTGLGLSISKGIIEQHNATIKLNRGFRNTCFEIRFPKVAEGQNAA